MLRGHKQYCPYQSCACEKCRFTAEQQRQMRLQNAIRRAEAQDRGPNSTSGGSGSGRRQRNSSSSAAAALQHQHQQNQQQQQQQLQQIVVSASSSQPEPQRNGTGTPPGKHKSFHTLTPKSSNIYSLVPLALFYFTFISFLLIYIKSKKTSFILCIFFYFYYKFYSSFFFISFIFFILFYFFIFSYPSRNIKK